MKMLVSSAIRRCRRRKARRRFNPNSGVPFEDRCWSRRRELSLELPHDEISAFAGRLPFLHVRPRRACRRVSPARLHELLAGLRFGSLLKALLLSSLYILAECKGQAEQFVGQAILPADALSGGFFGGSARLKAGGSQDWLPH